MTVAIIANDKKKELMVQFCLAYCGILAKHQVCGTGTTARLVTEATGLNVKPYLSGAQGGVQQIAARVAYNEIDLVIFFDDPNAPNNDDVNDLSRTCDSYNVPIATNIATAEPLILSLGRGDLDWRDVMRSSKHK